MKKFSVLLLALIMCLMLTACKSEAATNADALISEIGEVTLDSENKIVEAEKAVAALEDRDREKLEYAQILLDARAEYDKLAEEFAKDTEAQKISDAISSIGTVTADSGAAIKNARKLYNDQDTDVQNRVKNYSVLEAAEESFDTLKAAEVTALISEIGTVTLESEEKISSVQAEYAALSSAGKSKVENADILESAQETLKTLKAEAREKAKKAALAKMTSKTDKVEGITWYYSKNQPKYVNSRSYVLPYIGQTDSKTWLRLKCDYTGDNWVFFEKIIFVVDSEKYTKHFDYYDIRRDNDHGDVWEIADFSPSDSDIEMLKAIADSSETIVRFQGDDKHYDMTVKSADKQAIKDVLAAYEFLK